MLDQKITVAVNRLLATLYRSLPMYLTDASPWIHEGDERAVETLYDIVADQKAACARIAQYLQNHQAPVDTGEYPMEFTATHDLSLDFLISRLICCQKRDLATLERLAGELAGAPQARSLAEEAVGAARAHLEALKGLAAKVSQPT